MFSYRVALKKAFEVVWSHKYLWFFGFFATFLAGGEHFNLAFGRINQAMFKEHIFFNLGKALDNKFVSPNVLIDFQVAFQNDPATAFSTVVFLLILLVVFAFFVWLVVASEIALINNSAVIIKKGRKTSIQEGVNASFSNFWSVLATNLIGRLFILFLLTFTALPIVFLSHQSSLVQDLLYILLFILFMPVAMIIGLMIKYASSFMVISGKKFIPAIESAWDLFLKNWLVSIESAFIILFINAIICLCVFLLLLIIATPYLFVSYILAALLSGVVLPAATFSFMLSIGVVLGVFSVVIIGSVLTSFRTVAWTNIFLELTSKRSPISKLMRLLG